MGTKTSFSVVVPTSVEGVADLANVGQRFASGAIDAIKAQEFARSALDEALGGPARGASSTLAKVTFTIEPATAQADIVFADTAA